MLEEVGLPWVSLGVFIAQPHFPFTLYFLSVVVM